MRLELSEKNEARLFTAICLIIGTIMFYRGITDFILFKGNPYRTLLGLIFFGGVVSIYLMYRRLSVGFWLFVFFDFSVGIVFIFFLEDIWYHHVLPHVAYAAVFVPFYKLMRWHLPPDPTVEMLQTMFAGRDAQACILILILYPYFGFVSAF